MSIQNLECQLVRAQIARYLGGESFSGEAMRQLEVHLVACEDCKDALASRKAELRAKIGVGANQPMVGVSAQAAAKLAASRSEAGLTAGLAAATGVGRGSTKLGPLKMPKAAVNFGAFQPRSVATEPQGGATAGRRAASPEMRAAPRPKTFTKPVVLTFALAGVLLCMSRMSRSGFGPLGERADALFASLGVHSGTTGAVTDGPASPDPAKSIHGVTAVATAVTRPAPPKPQSAGVLVHVAAEATHQAVTQHTVVKKPALTIKRPVKAGSHAAAPTLVKAATAKKGWRRPVGTLAPRPSTSSQKRLRHRRKWHAINAASIGQVRVYDSSGAAIK